MKENVLERMERLDSKERMRRFMVNMNMPYEFKRTYAEIRAREFVDECGKRDLNYHVSVGGLDSITLLLFLRSIGIDCPAISVSTLEDESIQRVHKALGITRLKSAMREDGTRWTKAKIIQDFGFPVLSKEIAGKIELLQNPSEKNKTVRHAIITGETGEYGGYQKNSRMKMAQKWLEKFGGYENETEGTEYGVPNFKVSSKCCYYLKEKPCDDWAKEHNSVPFLGIMASEGGRRAKSLKINGCNYFGASTIRSAPFAIFQRHDILSLALDMDAWWKSGGKEETYARGCHEGWYPDNYALDDMPNSVIPTIYGEIATKEDGTLYTTGAQRTGCSMCGFGIHLEKRPNRFDALKERNEKEYDFWMNRCVTDETGTYGWKRVLDYIGVSTDELPREYEQMTMGDYDEAYDDE
jgi:hypothetical protein